MSYDSRKMYMDVIRKWMSNISDPAEEDCWAPEIEKADRETIKQLQSEKLEAAFRYVYEYSPFYRNKYKKAGLTPRDIKSIDDIYKIPVTNKEDLRMSIAEKSPWGNFSCTDKDLWESDGWIVLLTSGSTGEPMPSRHTHFDRKTAMPMVARQMFMSGVRRSDLVLYCVPFMTHIYSWHMYAGLTGGGIPAIMAGPPAPTSARINYIMRYKPTVLISTPTYALFLGQKMLEQNIDPKETTIRLIIVAGEPGGSILATRRRARSLWAADFCDWVGTTEVGGVGGHMAMCSYETKDHGRDGRLHFNEDAGIPEVLDSETLEPVPEGDYGSFVWSSVSSVAQPILRFNLNDMVNIMSAECPCGRTLRSSEGGIVGRTDDMVSVRGVNVFPSNIEEAVRSLDGFRDEYRMKIINDKYGMPDLIVEAEIDTDVPEKEHAKLKDELVLRIKDKCQIRVSVVLVPFDSLPRGEFKTKRVIDLRKQGID